MLHAPEWKRCSFKIPTIYGDVYLSFKQASAQETIDYSDMVREVEEGREEEVVIDSYWGDFFDKHNTTIVTLYQFPTLLLVRFARRGFIKKQIRKEFQYKYHVPYQSIYHDYDIPSYRSKGEDGVKQKTRKGILSRDMKNFSDYTGTPMHEVFERYTYEQIGYYGDCMLRDYLESFDEGKALNDRVKNGLGMSLTDEQKARLEYIKAHSTYHQKQ